jgi:tetratricopeptide (TPR) repeat protein
MPSIRYRNFPIRVDRINPKTGRYKIKINGSVPGSDLRYDEQEVGFYSPSLFDVNVQGQPVNLLQLLKARKITEERMYKLGTILSNLLLPGSIRERFWESLSVVQPRGQGLRLCVTVQAPELALLPWEYLYLPRIEGERDELAFLALQRDISIVRHEAIGAAEPFWEQGKEHRLVFAAASPGDQDQLEVEKDRDAISQMIARQQIGSVQPVWIKAATRKLLRENLRQPTDIFHFAGHGLFDNRKGQIVLDTGKDTSDLFDAKPLAKLLQNACVKLAVLNACETAVRSDTNLWGGVASALVKAGTAAVVASQYRLQDRNAVPLAEELYRSVLSGETVDEAVYQARLALYTQSGLENRDWGAPVLYLKVDDGVIFPRVEQSVNGNLAPHVAPRPLQTELIGRQNDLDQALTVLRNHSKCYFHGSYGVGKTSLAIETFTRAVKEIQFAGGHLWGRVANMDAEKVLEWVAAQFPGKTVARAIGQEAKINALRELLAPRDFLLGLDEVSDPEVVSAVLDAAGTNRVVLNSRPRFNTKELATEIALTPLDPADAEELFARLANKPLKSLTPEQYQIVKSICGKMKYLPMAIKLAALKCAEGGESIETLWDRLQVAPETLIEDYTLFETIHDNLRKSPTALRLLVKIASFPTLEAPLAALRSGLPNEEFFESKDKLIAFGVVEPAGADRLSLHPVLGLGVQKSEAEDLKVEVQNTIQWLQEFAFERRNDYSSLDRERANLLGSCDRLQRENRWNELIAVIRSLFHYLRIRGHWQEALQRLNASLTSEAKLEGDFRRGWAHLHRGVIFVLRSETDKAKHDFAKADGFFTNSSDTTSRGRVLYRLGALSAMEGDLSSALVQLQEALRLMGHKKHRHDRAGAHERVAGIFATEGKLEQARAQYELALKLGDREDEARVNLALGDLERLAGNYETARRHFARAAELVKQLGHVLYQASLEQELGYVNYYSAEYQEALGHFQAAQDLYQQLQYQPGLAQVVHALGNIALADNKLDEARAYYAQALELNEKRHLKGNAAYNKYQLGVVAHKKQDWREAREQYEAVLAVAESIGDVALQAAVHLQLSSLDLVQGDQDVAQSHATEALRLGQQVKDELTTAAALYNLGWQSAVQGKGDDALRNLTAAHERLVALHSADAMKVKEAISQPKAVGGGGGGGGFQPLHRNLVGGGPAFQLFLKKP